MNANIGLAWKAGILLAKQPSWAQVMTDHAQLSPVSVESMRTPVRNQNVFMIDDVPIQRFIFRWFSRWKLTPPFLEDFHPFLLPFCVFLCGGSPKSRSPVNRQWHLLFLLIYRTHLGLRMVVKTKKSGGMVLTHSHLCFSVFCESIGWSVAEQALWFCVCWGLVACGNC